MSGHDVPGHVQCDHQFLSKSRFPFGIQKAVQPADQSLRCDTAKLVLPDAHYRPALIFQCSIRTKVPSPISVELNSPEARVGDWTSAVVWA
jgi:hypothetical protein